MKQSNVVLRPADVAERLGVSEKTVYRLMQEHQISYSQIAKRKRVITEGQLAEYIEATKVLRATA